MVQTNKMPVTIIYKINKVRKHRFYSVDAAAEFAAIKFCLCEKDKNYLKQYGVLHRPDYDIEINQKALRTK